MKLLIICATIGLCSLANGLLQKDVQEEWLEFQLRYGKRYRSVDENQKRFQNFVNNLNLIKKHNQRFKKGLATYQMAVSPYTDMDLKEMEKSYMGLKMTDNDKQQFQRLLQFDNPTRSVPSDIPKNKDWRESGCVTPVKDQKNCGSCWAFSSTGALEAHHFLKLNESVILSEQNLVDCSTANYGCSGGWMIPSFEYVRENKGINPESQYPYQAIQGKCRFQRSYIAATCAGYRTIRQGDEQALLEAVAKVGPIAVAISVNGNFMNYKSGIYDDPNCPQTINHAVLLVGYGTDNNGTDYWLVKNSWGTSWGDSGYIKMRRNRDNQCAIASYGVYPVV